ncbi:MAG: hypothetical protein SNF33_01815 [Candidatus Algichlamydia australiensis]|nr:hypothetical protein [Chlamydiales bacterium]
MFNGVTNRRSVGFQYLIKRELNTLEACALINSDEGDFREKFVALLEYGIDVNHKNGFFLNYFLSMGDLDMGCKLLNYHANISLTKRNYKTVIPPKEFSSEDFFLEKSKLNMQKIGLYIRFAELKELHYFVNFLRQYEINDSLITLLEMRLQESWDEAEREEIKSIINQAKILRCKGNPLWVIPESYGWGV